MDVLQDIPEPPKHSWKPLQAHFQENPISRGCSALLGAVSSGILSRPYPEVKAPGRIYFPGFSNSQTANSTKSRMMMQAQSSASAMLCLHTAYTGATPGILTPLPKPKPAKGMRDKLVAWKKKIKKEQHLELLSRTAEITFITRNISHLIKIIQEGFGN